MRNLGYVVALSLVLVGCAGKVSEDACIPGDCMASCWSSGHLTGGCLPTGQCACLGPDDVGGTSGLEVCDDGQDNNANDRVDEDCTCARGSTQTCYSGPPATRNRGVCHDGMQRCSVTTDNEFSGWGPCTGEQLPGEEECGDGVDNNCNGQIDDGCTGTCVPTELGRESQCGDGIDNDCDNHFDCYDPDCPPCGSGTEEVCGNALDDDVDLLPDCADPDCCGDPACAGVPCGGTGEICGNSLDDDVDSRVDCADPECCDDPACAGVPCGGTGEICHNSLDDDADLLPDCNDPDCCDDPLCAGSVICGGTGELCRNSLDDDADLLPDCSDPDCCTDPFCAGSAVCGGGDECCVPGTDRWCDTPSYCSWGRQDCLPDGRWGACFETTAKPPGCGGFYYDTACCVASGECCQNFPGDENVGNCSGISAPCSM